MQPNQTPDAAGPQPSWQPQNQVPDFFASRAVVMPPPEPGTTDAPPALPPTPAYLPPPPAAATYGAPASMYGAPQPMYGQVPWAATPSPARSNRRFLLPSALTGGALVIAAVLVATFGVGGSSALSNTQMLALVHNASNGFTRSPATTFTMTVTTSAFGQQETLNISGVTSADSKNGSFTMTGPGINESFRAVNGVVYVQLPAGVTSMNGGKEWVGVRSIAPTAQEQQLESSGPEGMLKALANAGGTVQREGTQTIDGAQTTEYSVHIDVTKILASEDPQLASNPAVQSLGLNDLPMKIWIDKQGLPRRMTMDMSLNGATVDEVATMTPSNVVPKVSAPPASQVRMFNSLSDFEASISQLYNSASRPSY